MTAAALLESAIAQARQIANGQLTSAQLLATQADAVSRMNPSLNAFVETLPDPLAVPSAQTGAPSGSLLAGTSFAVKDNLDVAGMRSRCGLRALNAPVATHDATAVARLKAGGLVLTGRLAMAPMAVGASTHNPDFGDCFNPLRAGFSAGGSSGGSASAVAAGLVSIALGTDTLGSVRLPAALCGIVGFKPTWGHIPTEGLMPLCRSLDHIGILARCLDDVREAYRLLSDRAICVPSVATEDSRHASRTTVRFGMPVSLAPLSLDTDVRGAFEAACKQLQNSGCELVDIDFSSLDFGRIRRAGLLQCEAELLTTLGGIYPERKHQLPRELTGLLDYASACDAMAIGRANACLADAKAWLQEQCGRVDALLLPTSPCTAFSMAGPVPANVADLTALANVMGSPAISLPLPAEAGGLPAGLQLVGQYHGDANLLALAEQVQTWLP